MVSIPGWLSSPDDRVLVVKPDANRLADSRYLAYRSAKSCAGPGHKIAQPKHW